MWFLLTFHLMVLSILLDRWESPFDWYSINVRHTIRINTLTWLSLHAHRTLRSGFQPSGTLLVRDLLGPYKLMDKMGPYLSTSKATRYS